MRTETDFLGNLDIPNKALYGIHSLRAKSNFNNNSRFDKDWYQAMGIVKLACYQTYSDLKHTAQKNLNPDQVNIEFFSDQIIKALTKASKEISEGKHYNDFIVPAVQGGAGTSINMNINEIIANRSLQLIGKNLGEYQYIDPFIHANVFQSTNDVVPTALKVAVMKLLNELEESINNTRNQTEICERNFRNSVRIGYTQMQKAVPSSYGMLFSTYSDALSRDWWRVSKCFERIKQVNLGGGAIGTGIAVPKFFIMEATQNLQRITGLPVTRGENLPDTTANLDSYVEVHAILKAHAVNLEKIASDIRLLASDLSTEKVSIPALQTGSSIMPGKVNPVISEYLISISHKIYSNDMLVSNLCGQSCLDLNAYTPLIGNVLLESIKLLISANQSVCELMLKGLQIQDQISLENLLKSPSISTALIPYIGYNKATSLAKVMKEKDCDIYVANEELKLMETKKLKDILLPQNLLKLGFSVKR